MSRIYITASMQHSSFGIAMPTLSIDTTDHIGGGFNVGGLHPASIAAMAGKLPAVERGERFDVKFNVNAKRSSIALVVATTKHLPHLEWSSENGMGKLPMGVGALASTLLLGGSKKSSKSEGKQRKSARISSGEEHHHHHHRKSRSSKSRSHHSSQRDSHSHKNRNVSPHESHSHKSRSHASSSVDPDRSRSRHSSAHDSRSTRSRSHVSSAYERDQSRSRHASPRNSYSIEERAFEAHDPYVKRSHRSSRPRRNYEYLYEEDDDEEDDSGYGSRDRYESYHSRDSHKKHERSRYR